MNKKVLVLKVLKNPQARYMILRLLKSPAVRRLIINLVARRLRRK